MSLSVIVTSYESPRILECCLRSLTGQPEAKKIVVVDCSRVDPAVALGPVFPHVKFVHYGTRIAVPAMRWSVIGELDTEVVAAVEARCIPAPDWCAMLLRAHKENPEVPAIGGPVAAPLTTRSWELALFFSEYGYFVPPIPSGAAVSLSGANLSYKRAALLAEQDLLEAGRWETLLHLRWLGRGKTLYLTQAEVRFENTMSLTDFVRQRFAYGRGYAADRVESSGLLHRLAYAFCCIGLPFLLTMRIGRSALKKGLGGSFVKCLIWVILFQTAWSAGEFVGYLTGVPRKSNIF